MVDRFDCVHYSVPIYDVYLALFDWLAEHILVELDARIGSTKYASYTSDSRYSINRSEQICGRAMCVECAEIRCGEKFNLGYCLEHRDCYVTK